MSANMNKNVYILGKKNETIPHFPHITPIIRNFGKFPHIGNPDYHQEE